MYRWAQCSNIPLLWPLSISKNPFTLFHMKHYSFCYNSSKSKKEMSDREEIERQSKLTKKNTTIPDSRPRSYCWCDRFYEKKDREMDSPRLSDILAFPSRWILQLECQDPAVMQWIPLECLKYTDWLQLLLYAHLFARAMQVIRY